VQTLPRRLLVPLLSMIRELSKDWGCTFVFCTATQPAFQRRQSAPDDKRWEPGTIREIIRQPQTLRTSLTRVQIEWELRKSIGWRELADRMLSEFQVLSIVNLRGHASALFDEVAQQARSGGLDKAGLFHLSTRMCAAHRLDVLGRIRERLNAKLSCYVISTQLVEAGVDLDFPVVFRAIGPLDAIYQAAGRADREGLLTGSMGRPGGRVVVFVPEDDRVPPNEYKEARDLTRALIENEIVQGNTPQVDSVDLIDRYFERYYTEGADLGAAFQEMRARAEFATLAENFEMISSRTRDVFVPFGKRGEQLIEELRCTGRLTRDLRHRLQRYIVGLQPYEFETAHGVLVEIRPESEIWTAVERAYCEVKGLKLELSTEELLV